MDHSAIYALEAEVVARLGTCQHQNQLPDQKSAPRRAQGFDAQNIPF